MTEELTQLPLEKLHAAYIQARTNLSTSRNEAILLRLLQIADKLPQQTESPTQAEAAELLLPKAEDLQSAVSAFERRIIQEALTQSNGKVTHAAKLLNITHQSLSYTINTRHKDLLSQRSPVKHRIPKDKRHSLTP